MNMLQFIIATMLNLVSLASALGQCKREEVRQRLCWHIMLFVWIEIEPSSEHKTTYNELNTITITINEQDQTTPTMCDSPSKQTSKVDKEGGTHSSTKNSGDFVVSPIIDRNDMKKWDYWIFLFKTLFFIYYACVLDLGKYCETKN